MKTNWLARSRRKNVSLKSTENSSKLTLSGGAPVRSRLAFLDGMRALAALFVLIHHAWATIYPPQLGVQPSGIMSLTNWAKLGPYGVTVFIVLAGFSLALAVVKNDGRLKGGWLTFLRRRAWRILPPYYAALVVTVVLSLLWINQKTGTHWDLSVPLSAEGAFVNLFLVQDLGIFKTPDVAYTFWSIAVEWHIYFIFPVLLVLWRRHSARLAVISGLIFGLALGLVGHFVVQLQSLHPQYYSLFALAIGACYLAESPPRWASQTYWWLLSVAAAGAAVVAGSIKLAWFLVPLVGPDMMLGLAVSCALIALKSRPETPAGRLLAWKPLAYIGTFSYSIYLVHAPLLQVLWLVLVRPFNLEPGPALMVMWFGATPILLILAFLFYLIAERPFVRSQRRRLNEARIVSVSMGAAKS